MPYLILIVVLIMTPLASAEEPVRTSRVPAWEDMLDAKVALANKRYDRAIEYFRSAARKDPASEDVYPFMIFAALLKRDPIQAQAMVNAAKAKDVVPREEILIPEGLLLYLNNQSASLENLVDETEVGSEPWLALRIALAAGGVRNEKDDVWKKHYDILTAKAANEPMVKLLTAFQQARDKAYAACADTMQEALMALTSANLFTESVTQIIGVDLLLYRASRQIQQVISEGDPTIDQLKAFGFITYYLGAFPESKSAFDQILEQAPQDEDALLQQGIFHVLSGQYADAITTFEEYLRLFPGHDRARKLLAASLGLNGDTARAVTVFEELKPELPEDPEVWTNLGVFYLAEEQPEKAKAAYLKAMEVDPDYADAFRNHGILLARSGSVEPAVRFFEKAVQANPLDGESCKYIGLLAYDAGNLADARRWLMRANTIVPGDIGTSLALAVIEVEDGNFADALRLVEPVVEAIPENAQAQATYAGALLGVGRAREARVAAEKAVDLEPENEAALRVLKAVKSVRVDGGTLTINYTVFRDRAEAVTFRERAATLGFKEAGGDRARTVEIEPGSFIPAIEAAAQKLSAGQVSEVIETDRGYFIIERQ